MTAFVIWTFNINSTKGLSKNWDVRIGVPSLAVLDATDLFPEATGQDVYWKITLDTNLGIIIHSTKSNYIPNVQVDEWIPVRWDSFNRVEAHAFNDWYFDLIVEVWDDDSLPGEDDLLATTGTIVVHILFGGNSGTYGIPIDGVAYDGKTYMTNGVVDVFITTSSVGGVVIPIDKSTLLVPYIGLASTTIVVAAAIAIYVKRAKQKKEKQ